jgi:hypothetical protein
MTRKRPSSKKIAIAGYLAAIAILTYLSFDFGADYTDVPIPWFFILLGTTLPWSLLTVFFAWTINQASVSLQFGFSLLF